jgi:excisionase family DNA binding protein
MSAKLAYTFEEAAEQVGYSVRTLRRAAADGMLIVRYGTASKPVIRHSELEAWLEALPTEAPVR